MAFPQFHRPDTVPLPPSPLKSPNLPPLAGKLQKSLPQIHNGAQEAIRSGLDERGRGRARKGEEIF